MGRMGDTKPRTRGENQGRSNGAWRVNRRRHGARHSLPNRRHPPRPAASRHRGRRVRHGAHLRRVTLPCIMKIRHKGLRALHERDAVGRLPADLVPRLRRILFRLQEATRPGSAEAPGFRLHPLKGTRAGQWSVRVSGNWCVVFRFDEGEAVDVDLIDYH